MAAAKLFCFGLHFFHIFHGMKIQRVKVPTVLLPWCFAF